MLLDVGLMVQAVLAALFLGSLSLNPKQSLLGDPENSLAQNPRE